MAWRVTIDAQTAAVDATLLQKIVDSYGRILQEADGSRATNTLTTKANALTDVVDQLSRTSIDTIGELIDISKVMDKLFSMAANTATSGATDTDFLGLSRSDLGLLGLKGSNGSLAADYSVSDAEFRYFCSSVVYSTNDGTAINTFDQLQKLLTTAIGAV